MAKIVIGLFDTFSEAQNVVQDLVNNGVPGADISLVASATRGEHGHEIDETDAAEGSSAGAISGGIPGGMLGLFVVIGAPKHPGIGPVLAAGPLAAALGAARASTLVGTGIGVAASNL